jgi:hypothetical protein
MAAPSRPTRAATSGSGARASRPGRWPFGTLTLGSPRPGRTDNTT